ncbi:MAG: hypothetical protein U1E54_04295 [Candidatus Levybacteria bacterium]|nr:hypothetical protein [Candidatus Levybacteria bacterium]
MGKYRYKKGIVIKFDEKPKFNIAKIDYEVCVKKEVGTTSNNELFEWLIKRGLDHLHKIKSKR